MSSYVVIASLDRAAKLPNHESMKRVAILFCALLFGASIFGAGQEASGLLAKGTKWETPFYSRDSGKPGPTVVLTGGIHGNEPAGAGAAEQIRHWPIKRGRLIIVPRVNRPGLERVHAICPMNRWHIEILIAIFPRPTLISQHVVS